jgi:ribonuclease-3
MSEEKISELENILGAHFKDKTLLKSALTHKSYLNEHPECFWPHNERLEFLGDAVLELVISEYIFKNIKKSEGEMTSIRAAIVRAESLSEVANNLGLEKFLYLSKGEESDTGRAKKYILANALEAIIGAIFIDQGIEIAKKFIEEKIILPFKDVLNSKEIKDPKTKFQELSQEKFSITPSYKVLEEWGPEHKKNFLVGAYLKDKLVSKGQGFSKQEAEENAAKIALKKLF